MRYRVRRPAYRRRLRIFVNFQKPRAEEEELLRPAPLLLFAEVATGRVCVP